MLDENEICEEVQALLNRMDMFPEEFSKEVHEDHRWQHILNEIDDETSTNPYTALERTMLRARVRALTRMWMKRAILREITNAPEELNIDPSVLAMSKAQAQKIKAQAQKIKAQAQQMQMDSLVYSATQGRSKTKGHK